MIGSPGMMTRVTDARGLMLDIGGVVLRNAATLMSILAETDERLAAEIERLGVATERDALWHAMLAYDVTERAYWAQRSADLGAAIGEVWDTRTMINRIYERPSDEWLVPEVNELMRQVVDAGLPLAALTNDLEDFHGREWVERQEWLKLFDVVIDASITGVLKPDPRAYAAGAAALGLPPEEIVYLDDMPWNIAGGIEAGLQAIQVGLDDPRPAVTEARRRLGLPLDEGT
jgi:putative hydrolase of the HAD superfamily